MNQEKNDVSKDINSSPLANFQVTLFVVTMGLGGLALAYERLNLLFDLSQILGELLKWLTAAVFAVITIIYALKFARYPKTVFAELIHPVRVNFFAAFSISLLLLAALFKDTKIYEISLYLGLCAQTLVTLYVVSFWMRSELAPAQSSPAWFIPVVGNLVAPLAMPATSAFAWYYFCIGAFFWLVLFTIVFYRLVFEKPLAPKLTPTLFIFIAPPALAFLGVVKLTGSFGAVGQILINLTLFFVLLMIFMLKDFLKIKFSLSCWAFTFPMAAASSAFFLAFEMSGERFWLACALVTFAALALFVCFVGFCTLKAAFRGEICVAEG
ncbi:MAG: SLAC1 anion channel family protein [Campylobacter curvus]